MRILIIRLSALGDAVHGLPVLTALREAYPKAHVGWVAEPAAAALLAGHPFLDRLHVAPRRWLRHPGSWPGLRKELRAERYDIALDVQGLSKSALLARFFPGARRRIGFARPDARELAPWCYTDAVRVGDDVVHVVDRQLRLLEPLGIAPAAARFVLPAFPEAAAAVARRREEWSWRPGGYLALSAGGGWPAKLWPAERYAEVARIMMERRRLPSLATWSGAAERERAEAIERLSAGAARRAPESTLAELTEWLRGAAAFAGPDTGPLHIAVAAGTRTVSLYGPTLAERSGAYLGAAPRTTAADGPVKTTVAGRHATLQGGSALTPTDPLRPPPRGANRTDPAAMETIGTAAVAAALERVLDQPC